MSRKRLDERGLVRRQPPRSYRFTVADVRLIESLQRRLAGPLGPAPETVVIREALRALAQREGISEK